MKAAHKKRIDALKEDAFGSKKPARKNRQPKPFLVKTALDHVLDYARKGVPAIWIPRSSKAPIERGWPAKATTDPAIIQAWEQSHPNCNFGLSTNDLVVIDVDDTSVIPSLKGRGLELTPTRVNSTPGGGEHYIYRKPANVEIKNRTKVIPGVDIRAKGGQIVCPGSIHPNGGRYEIDIDLPIAELPEGWLALLTGKTGAKMPRDVIPEGQRHTALVSAAGTLRRHGKTPEEIEAALTEVVNTRCETPETVSADEVTSIAQSMNRYPVPANVQALLNDPRPKVELPGPDREVNAFADELGGFFIRKTFFLSNNVVVTIEDKKAVRVSAQKFRTLAAEEVVCYTKKISRNFASFDVKLTMTEDTAAATLASNNWRHCMRRLQRISFCRQPALRSDGKLILVPEGYHSASETWTDSDVEYDENMPLDEAVNTIKEMLSEFDFSDGELGRSMAVAGLLGFYARAVLPEGSTRPIFITDKNRPGAGATTLTRCMVLPVLGFLPTGVKPSNEEELRKTLTTAVLEQSSVVFLDNVKGRIDSPSLEAFTSSANWSDRLLGVNESVNGPVRAGVYITANGATSSEDFRRRCLRIRLHLRQERPEDRQFRNDLSDAGLLKLRPQILAACWALVKNWDVKGRPKCSRGNSSFPQWTEIVGGMVEAGGFVCPIPTASEEEIGGTLDEDRQHMRVLALAMKLKERYSFVEMAGICCDNDIFINLTKDLNDPAKRSAFGWLLKKADDTDIGDRTFHVEGEGRKKRYWVENCPLNTCRGSEVAEVSYHSSKKHDFSPIGIKPLQPLQPLQPKKYTRKAGQR